MKGIFKVEGIGQKKVVMKMQENWKVHLQHMVAPLKAVKNVYLLNTQSVSHKIRKNETKQKCTPWSLLLDNAMELVAYGIRQEKENRITKSRRKIITC